MTPVKHKPYTKKSDIVLKADISTDAHNPYFKQLSSSEKTQLVAARLRGYQPACIRWPTGQVAIVLCEHGTTDVCIGTIVAAYKECLKISAQFPEGEITCLP